MSAPPRPFLLRFTLALLGMLLLMAVVFTGMGWMVSRQLSWTANAIGEDRMVRLWYWYLGFMANVLPGDQDGDMVCDGAELFYGNDMRNPARRPFAFHACLFSQSYGQEVIAYCGERSATRSKVALAGPILPWPRGFSAVVVADQEVLLPKNGLGPPTKGPLTVSVNARGELDFDILAESVFRKVQVEFRDVTTNQLIDRQPVSLPGWRLPSVPVSLNGGPPVLAYCPSPKVGTRPTEADRITLKWTASNRSSGAYVVEATCEDGEGSWMPLQVVDATETQWESGNELWCYFSNYRGSLKFRVVPVSATVPETAPPR